MKNKKVLIISLAIIFLICIFISYNKETFSTSDYEFVFENKTSVNLHKNDLQKLVVNTAKAFYFNREYIKYNDDILVKIDNFNYMYRDLTISPEDINMNNTVYMDDISFVYSVYLNALGMDLSLGNVDLKSGYGFSVSDILNITDIDGDERLILETDDSSFNNQDLFITKYLNNIELGDIIVYKNDNEFHVALCVDITEDKLCIFFNDSNKIMSMEKVEDILFPKNAFISNDSYYAIIRPINVLKFNSVDHVTTDVPVNSQLRVNDVYFKRYTDISVDSVYRGEEIKYTIEVVNHSDNEVLLDKISDKLDKYLLFVDSLDGKYDVSENIVFWNNITLAIGESKKFSYTVKVQGEDEIDSVVGDDSVFGKRIVSNEANIFFDDDRPFILNTIDFKISNKYIDEQIDELHKVLKDVDGIKNNLLYGINGNDYKTDISSIGNNDYINLNNLSFYSFIYYNAFGIDFGIDGIMNAESLLNNLFTLNENGYYTRALVDEDNELSVRINSMVVENKYGGLKLSDKNMSKIFSSIISSKYSYSNLIPGDIILYWDQDGIINGYLYDRYLVDEVYKSSLISYTDMGVLKFDDVDDRINKIISRSSLYVVLRPSSIFDIELKDIEIDPISVKVGGEKEISFIKKPKNATINKIDYSSSYKFSVNKDKNYITGVVAGNDELKLLFNDKLEKTINVIVSKEIYDFKVVTDYGISDINGDKVIYVGTDLDVEVILNNISFNNNGYDVKIVDNKGEEITDKITGSAILEISSNGELVEQYKVYSISFNTDNDEEFVNDEDIIRYISIGTKVSDLKDILYFNGNSVNVNILNKDGILLADDVNLSTGDKVTFKIGNDLNYEYQISVLGDISGNGIFNGNDIVLTRRHIVGWINPNTQEVYQLSGVYVYAMDYSMNGIVNGNDVASMRRKLVN